MPIRSALLFAAAYFSTCKNQYIYASLFHKYPSAGCGEHIQILLTTRCTWQIVCKTGDAQEIKSDQWV